MKQLTKQEYQKRGLLINAIARLIELKQGEPVAAILSLMLSPIGETLHPFKWSDNHMLGVVEKEIYKVENNLEDEE